MATRKKTVPEVDLAPLVRAAEEALRAEGAIKLSTLKPAASRPAIVRALEERGFESGKTVIRVPVDAQLREILAGGFVGVKALDKRVKGATKAELARAVDGAVASGLAQRVFRGKVETLVGPKERVLAREELDLLRKKADALAKLLKGAKGALLRTDVEAILSDLVPQSTQAAAPVARIPTTDDVVRAVAAAAGSSGLAFVPKVVRGLTSERDVAFRALLEAASAERIELQPEGGTALLSADDASMCPHDRRGNALSWARIREGGAT